MSESVILFIIGSVVTVGVVPLLRLIYNQERQIRALEVIIGNQQQEIDLLRAIVLDLAPADVVKRHIANAGKLYD